MGKTMILELDNGSLETAVKSVEGLEKGLSRLRLTLNSVLVGQRLADYMQTALQKTGKLDDELLVLRLSLGKLRAAIGDAFAPIAQVVLPAINQAIFAAVRFVQMASRITHALFGIQDSAGDAADGEKELAEAVTASSKAAQKSLASFDRLNRLQGSVGTVAATTTTRPKDYSLSLPEFQFVQTLRNMADLLKKIDLTGVRESFKKLWTALKPILEHLINAFLLLYEHVLVPVAKWAAETWLPKVLETIALALDTLKATIESCKPALIFLWENLLKPIGNWVADRLLENLDKMQARLTRIGNWMRENEVPAGQLLLLLSQFLGKIMPLNEALELFGLLGIDTNEMLWFIGTALANLSPVLGDTGVYIDALMGKVGELGTAWKRLFSSSDESWSGLKSIWQGAELWFDTYVFNPLETGFRNMSNGFIDIMNALGGKLTQGFNGLFDSVNDISLVIPDWVPLIGGKTLGFSLGKLTMPQIPKLAQGAVLPANKPFLAMVGDQKHGTNIEAPLQTIRDAVKLELSDLLEGSIAGQEATVTVLRQILEAVLGISLTDADVGLAAERYRSRMSVVYGF